MTLEQIEADLQAIRDRTGDDESQHGMEDTLYEGFIHYISTLEDQPELAAKAKLVLTSGDISFNRWCA